MCHRFIYDFYPIQRWHECVTPKLGPKPPKNEIEKPKQEDEDSIEAQRNVTKPPAYEEIEQNGVENPAFEKEQKTEL